MCRVIILELSLAGHTFPVNGRVERVRVFEPYASLPVKSVDIKATPRVQ